MVDVEINYNTNSAVMKSDKMTNEVRVQKDRSGFRFFEIVVSSGSVPEELKGRYSSIANAVAAFKTYEHKIRKTKSVRRKEFAEEREERQLAKLHSESS